MNLTGLTMDKQCNRYTPGTLTRNTPIRAAIQHTFNARLTPFRMPGHIFNRRLGLFQQAIFIHRDKPLGCGAIN